MGIEDPVTKMLKQIMSDISEIKTDVKGNNNKIDELTSKVENLETKNIENENTTNEKFKQIKNDISKVEENVTSKLLKEIEPSLNAMKGDMRTSLGVDIRRIVQEELTLRDMKDKHASQVTARENKDQEESTSSEEWPNLEKNQKIQKKIKKKNQKKLKDSQKNLLKVLMRKKLW